MWFAFGILTLVGSIYISYRNRWHTNWKGAPRILGDLPQHELSEDTSKGRVVRVRVAVAAPPEFCFRVRKERFYDKFFKGIGLTVEMQVQDPQFDRTVYLESDVEGIGRLLIDRQPLRSAILKIFVHADVRSFRDVVIWCNRGRIWMQFRPLADANTSRDLGFFVALLKELSDGLAGAMIPADARFDRFAWRAIALLSISSATLLLGIFGMIRQGIGRTDIVEPEKLFIFCLVPTAIAIGLFVALIIAALGRTSRTHLVLLEGFFLGGLGFLLGTFALAREYNIDFDSKPASVYRLDDVWAEHRITNGRRGRTHHDYFLHIHDWREQAQGKPIQLEISRDDFERLHNTRAVLLRARPGALGFDWVESIEPYESHRDQR